VFEAKELLRRLADERLDRVLIAQPVAAGNGVEGVLVETVIGSNRAGGASFRGHRVAPHRIHLGDDRDIEVWICFGDGDSGAKAGAAAAYQHNVMIRGHRFLRRPWFVLSLCRKRPSASRALYR
jgi:hypothetical protein